MQEMMKNGLHPFIKHSQIISSDFTKRNMAPPSRRIDPTGRIGYLRPH